MDRVQPLFDRQWNRIRNDQAVNGRIAKILDRILTKHSVRCGQVNLLGTRLVHQVGGTAN